MTSKTFRFERVDAAQKSFYVEISGARERAELVTDDAKVLNGQLEAVKSERVSALEGIGEPGRGAGREGGPDPGRSAERERAGPFTHLGDGRRGRKWTRAGRRRASIGSSGCSCPVEGDGSSAIAGAGVEGLRISTVPGGVVQELRDDAVNR